jgi:hypothetical protein
MLHTPSPPPSPYNMHITAAYRHIIWLLICILSSYIQRGSSSGGCPDSAMTGESCENIRDWREYISHPWRGRPQPKLAKRGY